VAAHAEMFLISGDLNSALYTSSRAMHSGVLGLLQARRVFGAPGASAAAHAWGARSCHGRRRARGGVRVAAASITEQQRFCEQGCSVQTSRSLRL